MKLDLPLSTQAIRSIDRRTFDEIIRLANAQDHWNATRRDAQRTIHRGLDCGEFGLDRDLKIRMRIDLDERGNYIGPESTGTITQGTNPSMNTSQILVFGPTLSDEADAEVQPSLQDMVREHYKRRFGATGEQIAENYIDRLIDGIAALADKDDAPVEPETSSTAAASGTADAAPEAGHRPSPTDHDRTPLRSVVMAIIQHHHDMSHGERVTIPQLERLVRRWRDDARLVAIHPVLIKTDDQGGFSVNDESPLHVGSIARGLVSDQLLDRDSRGFAPKGTIAMEDRDYEARRAAGATATAGNASDTGERAKPEEAPKAPETPRRDAMDGIKDVFKAIGIDMRVGGVDIVKGIERTSRTGNALPLVASLATAVIAAAAASEMNRED